VPESQGFKQLEQLVRNLGDELAAFRKRAQVAEGRVRVLEGALSSGGDEVSIDRVHALGCDRSRARSRGVHLGRRPAHLRILAIERSRVNAASLTRTTRHRPAGTSTAALGTST